MALWKRYRLAVVCSLVHNGSLPIDLLLVLNRTLEDIRSTALVRFVDTPIPLCRSPPWGGSWPPTWELMYIHCFSGGRLTASTSVWWCNRSNETMATMTHKLKFIRNLSYYLETYNVSFVFLTLSYAKCCPRHHIDMRVRHSILVSYLETIGRQAQASSLYRLSTRTIQVV